MGQLEHFAQSPGDDHETSPAAASEPLRRAGRGLRLTLDATLATLRRSPRFLPMFSDPLVARMASFVNGIGIAVRTADLAGPTFLPGLDIRYGTLLVDEPRLLYPGDLLHEAGHIAVAAPEERKRERLKPTLGDEITTIAWSYAAACHLGIDPSIVFHPAGYRGASSAFLTNFAAGRYVGTPLLQAYGMTVEPNRALTKGVEPFPAMLRWVR
jgi:hypothetical protein